MGTTTIQVQDITAQMLRQLRDQYQVSTYDELLRVLIAKAARPVKSMYGAGGKMPMKEILKDLRDKHDRY